MSSPSPPFSLESPSLSSLVRRELSLFVRFTRRDIPSTVIPTVLFTASVLARRGEASAARWLVTLCTCALYFSLYVYTFCLNNQIHGVEEDRKNKPDRPIPAGLVSVEQATLRWRAAVVLFLIAGLCLGVVEWAILWIVVSILHNTYGWSRHWFTKNFVVMAIGTACELVPAWSFAAPLDRAATIWTLTVSAIVGVAISTQDFRDVEGDRATGRRTLPIAVGERPARALMATALSAIPLVVHLVLMPPRPSLAARIYEIALALMNLTAAARLLLLRSAAADDRTYMLCCYWYCALLGSGVVIF